MEKTFENIWIENDIWAGKKITFGAGGKRTRENIGLEKLDKTTGLEKTLGLVKSFGLENRTGENGFALASFPTFVISQFPLRLFHGTASNHGPTPSHHHQHSYILSRPQPSTAVTRHAHIMCQGHVDVLKHKSHQDSNVLKDVLKNALQDVSKNVLKP